MRCREERPTALAVEVERKSGTGPPAVLDSTPTIAEERDRVERRGIDGDNGSCFLTPSVEPLLLRLLPTRGDSLAPSLSGAGLLPDRVV